MHLFRLENINKSFKNGEIEEDILKGIDLELQEGKITALIGASGSGKSTLLTIAAGLQPSSNGNIVFDGYELNTLSSEQVRQIRANHFGFVFQFAHLVPFLTVEEQLQLMLQVANSELSKKDQKKEIKKMLELIDMFTRKNAYPSSLSGGEKQRVAVARAIIHKPKILFADEPTASLDSKRSKGVMKQIQHLSQRYNISVLMVTHDQDMLEYVDQIVEMRDGKIIEYKYNK
ncbi:ABC transporter ATP-binding protein [Oceanobacillus iheyensis]|uniref:ABC transporter ATP-binding protein n=1 Tax=Oceanobacillus iheyensis TaxID=182710 RepID=UPI00362B13E8